MNDKKKKFIEIAALINVIQLHIAAEEMSKELNQVDKNSLLFLRDRLKNGFIDGKSYSIVRDNDSFDFWTLDVYATLGYSFIFLQGTPQNEYETLYEVYERQTGLDVKRKTKWYPYMLGIKIGQTPNNNIIVKVFADAIDKIAV